MQSFPVVLIFYIKNLSPEIFVDVRGHKSCLMSLAIKTYACSERSVRLRNSSGFPVSLLLLRLPSRGRQETWLLLDHGCEACSHGESRRASKFHHLTRRRGFTTLFDGFLHSQTLFPRWNFAFANIPKRPKIDAETRDSPRNVTRTLFHNSTSEPVRY